MKYETNSRNSIAACGVLLLMLGLPGVLYPQSLSSGHDGSSETRTAAEAEVPFRLYNGNLIVVKATIGSIKNVNMILDTGTNRSIISKELASRLKMSEGSEPIETLNGTLQVKSLILPDIQLGSFHAASLRVLVQDFETMESNLGMSIGGVVGLDILSTGPFTINYEEKTVTFGSASMLRNAVPFASTEPFLTVRTTVNGQQVRLLLDSGTWELLLFRGRLHIAPNEGHLDRVSSVSTTGGSARLSWLHTNVSLGTSDLGVHKVAVAEADADPDFDGLLGFAGMGFHRVSFDFEKRVFSWE
jgi:predicted aspartyl protease